MAKFSVQGQRGKQLLSPVVLHFENQRGQAVRLQVLCNKPAHPELALCEVMNREAQERVSAMWSVDPLWYLTVNV